MKNDLEEFLPAFLSGAFIGSTLTAIVMLVKGCDGGGHEWRHMTDDGLDPVIENYEEP